MLVNDWAGSVDGIASPSTAALEVVEEIRRLGGVAVAGLNNVTEKTSTASIIKTAVEAKDYRFENTAEITPEMIAAKYQEITNLSETKAPNNASASVLRILEPLSNKCSKLNHEIVTW